MENIEFGIVNKPKAIIGYCDETGKPLYEGITYLEKSDGTKLHYSLETLIQHFNLHRVTLGSGE